MRNLPDINRFEERAQAAIPVIFIKAIVGLILIAEFILAWSALP